MRIIAGDARGRTILAPKGQTTRPTQDYVRESLFNIIQRDVPGSVVLDLFAGSGALALEALSRGAARAVLADSSRSASECIRRNVETLRYADRAVLYQGDWRAVLRQIPKAGSAFNLVFLDPPYQLTQYREITEQLRTAGMLAKGALIVIEHRKDVAADLSPFFRMNDRRNYGDTVISLFIFDTGGNLHE